MFVFDGDKTTPVQKNPSDEVNNKIIIDETYPSHHSPAQKICQLYQWPTGRV